MMRGDPRRRSPESSRRRRKDRRDSREQLASAAVAPSTVSSMPGPSAQPQQYPYSQQQQQQQQYQYQPQTYSPSQYSQSYAEPQRYPDHESYAPRPERYEQQQHHHQQYQQQQSYGNPQRYPEPERYAQAERYSEPPQQYAERDRYAGSQASASAYTEPARTRPRGGSSSSASSSTSSSLLNVSAKAPRFGGVFSTFWRAPSEQRERRRRKKQKARIFFATNSSSSSVNSDLAYGRGYIERDKSQGPTPAASAYASPAMYRNEPAPTEVRQQPPPPPEPRPKTDDEEILEIGRQLQDIARRQNESDKRAAGKSRASQLAGAAGIAGAAAAFGHFRNHKAGGKSQAGPSSKVQESSSDDDWESASEDESSTDSSDSSDGGGLAYGFDKPSKSARISAEPPEQIQPPGRKNTVVDPRLFGPYNSLRGAVKSPCGFGEQDDPRSAGSFRRHHEETVAQVQSPKTEKKPVQQPMQHVYPVPTSDPDKFDFDRASVTASRQDLPQQSRPAPVPVPLQQPKPIVPVSSKVYDADRYVEPRTFKRQTPTGRSPGRIPVETAIAGAGAAAAAIGVAMANRRDSADHVQRHDERRSEAWERRDHARESRDSRRPDERVDQPVKIEMDDRERRDRSERRSYRHSPVEIIDQRDKNRTARGDAPPEPTKKPEARPDARPDARPEVYRLPKGDEIRVEYDPEEDRQRREKPKEPRKEERKPEVVEERRDAKRVEKQNDLPRDHHGVEQPEVPFTQAPIDPFQFQVADDAFQTPKYATPKNATPKRPLTPQVVTVDREPNFDDSPPRKPDYSDSRMSRKDSFELEQRLEHYQQGFRDRSRTPEPRRRRDSFEEEKHAAKAIYDEVKHATAPVAAAALASAIAVEEQRSRKHRSEHVTEDGSRSSSQAARDAVQEEADRHYRETVLARKIAEDEIRSRSSSPHDGSVVGKYDDDKRPEVVTIVTPPEMDHPHDKSPYDAPNADVRIDHVIIPDELARFRLPEGQLGPGSTHIFRSRDPSCERERPQLNLVLPTPNITPRATPAPEQQKEADREARQEEKPKKSTREVPKPRSVEVTATPADIAPEVVPEPKQKVVERPTTPTAKSVTWGENETKSFEIESPEPPKSVPSSTSPKKSKKRFGKSTPWGVIAAAIGGAGAAAAATSEVHDPFEENKTTEDRERHSPPQSPKSRAVEPSSEPIVSPIHPKVTTSFEDDLPPAPGPKPSSPQTSQMPGAFADDLEFASVLAAGLQDTGFDPNIVIDNPTYMRRDSPPGQNEPIYQQPYVETVNDLGIYGPENIGQPTAAREPGHVISEVQDTPVEKDLKNGHAAFDTLPRKYRDKGKSKETEALHEEPAGDESEPGRKLSKKEKRKQKAAKRQSVESAPEETAKAVTPLDPFSQTAPEHDWNDDRSQSPSTVVSTVVSVGPKVRDPLDDPLWNSPSFSHRDRPVEEPTYDSRRYVDEPTYQSRRSDEEPTYDYRRSADEPTPRRQSEERRSPQTTRSLDDSPYAGTSFDELPSIQDTRSFDESSSLYSQPSEVPSSYVRSRDEPSSQAPASSETPKADDDAAAPTKLSKKEKKKKRSSRSDIVVVQEDGKEPQEIIVEEPRSYREELPEHNDTAPTEPREKDDDPLDSPVKKKKKSKKSKQSSDEWTDVEKQIEDVSAGGRSSPTKPVDDWDDRPAKSRRDRSRIDDQDTGSVVSDSTPRRSKSDRRSNGSRYEEDDAKSVASDGSGRKRRSRDDKKSVKDDDKKSTKEEEKRGSSGFFSLFRPGSGNKDTSGKEEKSFLDNAGTLGAGAGLASAVAALGSMMSRSNATEPQPEESEHSRSLERTASASSDVDILDPEITQRTIRPAIDPQYGDLLPLPPSPMPPSTPGSPTEELDDLPALPDSRPETPPEERRRQHEMKTHVRRRSNLDTPHKSPSQTAVPFKLRLGQRSSPSSPGNLGHAISPMTSPTAPTAPENALSRRPSIRPFSWESSKEIKPLYLLEQARQEHAAQSTEPHVDFPGLPPSEPSSRESPAPQFALRENDVEYLRQLQASPFEPDELRVNTDVFRSPAARDQFSSQETTPNAEQALHHTRAMYRPESPALPVVPDLNIRLELSGRDLAALPVLPASPASTGTEHEAAVPAKPSLERAVADLPPLSDDPESQPGLAEKPRSPVFLPESPALPGMPDAARQLESFEYEPMDLPSLPASPVTDQAPSPVMQFHDAEDFPALSTSPLAEDACEAPHTVPKFLPESPALPPVTETHRIDLPDHYFEALPVLPASPKVEPRASPKSVRFAPESPALPIIPDNAEGFGLPAHYLDELPALPSSPVAEYQPVAKGVSFAPESPALPSVVDAARLYIPEYDLAELPSLPASPVLEHRDRDIGPKFAPESPALPASPDKFRDVIFPVDSVDQLPALPGSPILEYHEPAPTISYAPESPSLPTWPGTGFRFPEQLETDLPALPLSPVLEQQNPPATTTYAPESPSLPPIPETFRHFDTPAYNVDELPSLPASPVAEHEAVRYIYAPESPALPSFPGANLYSPEQQLEDLPSLPGSPLAETEASLKKFAYAPESPGLPSVPDASFYFPEQQLEELPSLPSSPVAEDVSKKFTFAPESPALPTVSGAGFYFPEQQLGELPALPGSPSMEPFVTDREEIAPPRVVYAPESPALPSVPDTAIYFQEQQLDDLPSLPGSPVAKPLVMEREEPAPPKVVFAPESPALPSVQDVGFHFPEQSLEELPALPSSPTTEPMVMDREGTNAPRITFAPESPALPPQTDFYFPEQPMKDLPALPPSPVAEPEDHSRGPTLALESPALPHLPDASHQLYASDHQLEDLPALPTSPETLPAVGTLPEPEPVEVTSKDRSSYLLHMTPPSIVKNLMERDLPDTPPSPTPTRSLDRSEAMAKVEEESLSDERDVALGAVAGGAAAGLATTILGHGDQAEGKKQSDPDTQSLENFGMFEPAEPLAGTKLSKKAKKKKRKSKALSMDENAAPTEAATSTEPPAENAALPSNDNAPVSPIDKDRRQSIDAPREMPAEESAPPSGEVGTEAPAEAPSTEAFPSEAAPTSETRAAEETLPTEAPSVVAPPDEVSMPIASSSKTYEEDLPSTTHANLDPAAGSNVLSNDDTPVSIVPRDGLPPPVESIQRETPSDDVVRGIESLLSSANDNVRGEDTPVETQPEMPAVESKAPVDAEALETAPVEPSTADVPAEKKLSKKDKKKLKKAQARALELEHSAKPDEERDQIESATEPVPDQLPEDNFTSSLADDTLPAPETEAHDSMVEVEAAVADADTGGPALETEQASQLPEPQAATWLPKTETTVPASVPQSDEPALLPGTGGSSSAPTSGESKDVNEAEQPFAPSVTEPSSPETKKSKKKKKAKKALDLDGEVKSTSEASETNPVASEPVTPFPEQEVSAKLDESPSTFESTAPIALSPDAESQLQHIPILDQDDNQLARGDDVADSSAPIEEDVEKTASIDERTLESKPTVQAEEKPATLENTLSGHSEDVPILQDAPADGQPSLGPQVSISVLEEKPVSLDDDSAQAQTAPGEDEAKLGNTEDDLPLLPTLPADDVQPAQEPTSAVREITELAETSPTPPLKDQNLSLAAENEHVEAKPVFEQETPVADVHADLAENPELPSSESRGLDLEATPTSPMEATSENVYSGTLEDRFPKGSQPTTSEAETAEVPAAESGPKEDPLSTSEPIDNVPSTTHSAAELPELSEPGPASTQMPSAESAQPEQSEKKKKKKKKKSKGPSLSQLDDILSMENTPVQTPTTETPPVVPQAAETPLTETPAVETPLVDNPVVETPIVETPTGETIVETPAVETRDLEAPVVDNSVVETPILETPRGDTAVAFDEVDTASQITPAPAEDPPVEPPASNTTFGETTVVETPVIENPVVETPIVETPTGETTVETPAVVDNAPVEIPAGVEFSTEETTVVVETPAAVETQIIETPAAVETPTMAGAPEEKALDFTEEPTPDTVTSIEKGSNEAQGNDLDAAKEHLAVTAETQELPSSTLTESVVQADNVSPLSEEPSPSRKNEVSQSDATTIIPQDESMEPAAIPEQAPMAEETATKEPDEPETAIRESQEPTNAESNDEAFATPPQRPITIETEDDAPGSLSQEPTLLDSQIDAVDTKPQEPFIEKEQPRDVGTPVEPDSPVESKKSKKKKKKAAAAAAAAAAALQAAIEDTPGDQKDQKEAKDETITDKGTSITQDKTGDTESPPPELPTSGEFATDVKISEEADAGPAVTKKGKKKKKGKKSSTLDPEPENSPSTSIPESTADVANTMDKSAYVSSPPREPVSDEARFPPAESSTEAEPAANTGEQRRKSVTWAPALGSAANNSDLPLQEAGHGSEWQPEAATAPPPATGELQTTEPSEPEDRSEAESLPRAIGEEMQGSDTMAVDEASEGVAQKDLDPESQAQRHPASETTQTLPQQHEHEHAHDIAADPIDYFPSSSGLHATTRGATRSGASIPTAQQAYFPSAHRMLPATGSSSSGAANRKGGETLEGDEQAEQVASSEADATSDAEHAEQAGRSGAIGKPSATADAQTGEVGTSDPGLHAIVEQDSGPGHDKSLVDTQNGRMTDAEPVGPALTDSALEAGGPQNTPVQPLANQDSNPKIPQPLPSHAASSSTSPLDEVPSPRPRPRPRHTPSSPSLLERAKNSDAGIIDPAAAAAASAESRPEDFNLNDSPYIGDFREHKAEEEQHPVPRATDAALPGQTAAPESLGEFIASEPQVDSSSETVPGPEPTGIVNAGSTTQSPDETETQPEEGADVWSEPATPSNMSKKDKKKAKKAKAAAAGEPDDVEDTQARDVDDSPSAAEPGASAPIESSAQPEPASIPDAASAPGAEDIALWAGDEGWAIQPNSKKSKKDKKKKRAAAQAADEADAVVAQPEESSSKPEEIVAEQAPPSPPAQDERSPSLEDAVNEHQTTAETSDVPLETSEAVVEGVPEDVPGVSHVPDAPHDTSAGDEQPQAPQEADDAGSEVPTKKSKKNKKKQQQQQQQSSVGEEAQGSLQDPTRQDHQPGHGESTSTPAPAPPVDTLPADAEHLQLSRDPQPLDDTLPEDSSKASTQEDTLILDRPEDAPNPASVSQPPPAAEAEVPQEAQTMPSDSIADTTVLAEDEFPVVSKKSKKDKKKKKKGLETPDEPIVTLATEPVVEQTSPPQQTPAPESQPTPAEVPAVDEPAFEQIDSSEPAGVLEPDAPSFSTPMPAEQARPLEEEEPISPKKSKKDKKKKKKGASADILAEQPLPTETETPLASEAALIGQPEQMVMPETESTPQPTNVFTEDATATTDEPQTLQEEVAREQPMDTTPDDEPVRQESSIHDATVGEATPAVIAEPSQHEDPMDLDVAATEELSKADVPPVAETALADTVLDLTQTAEAPQPVTVNAEDEFPIPEKKSKKDKKKSKKAQEAHVEPALEAEPAVEQSFREETVAAEPEPASAAVEPAEEIPILEEEKTPVQEPEIIETSQPVVAEDEFPLPDKKAKKSKKKKGQALEMIEPQPSLEPAAESAVNPVTERSLDIPSDNVPSAEDISQEPPTDTPADLNDVQEPATEAQDVPLPDADTLKEDVALEADKARSDEADTFDIPEGQPSSLPLDDEPSSPKLSKKDKKKKKKAKLQDDSNVLSATPTVEVPEEPLPNVQEAAQADITAPPFESTQPPQETSADLIESTQPSEEVPADPASNATSLTAPATLPAEDSMEVMPSQSAEADVVHTQESTAPQPEQEVPLTPKKSKKDKKKKKKGGLFMDDAAVEQETSRSLPVADGASDDLPAAENSPAAEAPTNIPSEASIPAPIEPVVEKVEFQDEMDIDVEPATTVEQAPSTSTSDAPVIVTETLPEPTQPAEEIVPAAPIAVDQPTTTSEPKLESVNDVPSASLEDAMQTKEAAVALPEDEWPETLPAKKSKKDKKKKKSQAQNDLMASEAAPPAGPAVEEFKEEEPAVSTIEEAKIPDIAAPDIFPDERNLSEPLNVDANMGLVREMERPHSPADKILEKQETAPAEEKQQDATTDAASFDPLAAWTNEWSSAPTKKSKKDKKKKKRQNQVLEDAEVATPQEDDITSFKPESEPSTAADSFNNPPTIAEPSDAISTPPSPARARTPALAEQSILSVRSRSPDLKEHSVLSRRSESPDLAERSLLSGRSRTPNYAEQSVLSGQSRSPNYTEGSPRSRRTRSPGYTEGSPRSRRTRSPGYTEGSPRSRRSRSPGYTDGSFLTRRSRSPNYTEGSPRSRRSRSPGYTDGSFLTRRSRSPTYGDRSLLSGRSRSRNYTERSLLSRRSRSPNYTEGSFLTRRSRSPNYTEHSLLSRRSRRSRSPNYTEHSNLSGRSRSPNYAERSMLSIRSRSPDFAERSMLSERPTESVAQEDDDRESRHDNSKPQSPAAKDRAHSSASHRQDVNVDADGSRPASPTAALDTSRSMDLPETTRSSLDVVDLGAWDVPVTKKSKKGKKGKKQSIPVDVESPQNIDPTPTPAPNADQSLAPEGAENVGYFDKEPLEENRSASAPPPPETASTLLTPADTPRPVDATAPSPKSSTSADVDLTPAQETSRVVHEVPYEQPDKRKKLKTREQSNTLLPEPIFSSRDIAAVDLEDHGSQENNAVGQVGTIADVSLLPTSTPDASEHQGPSEPSVDRGVSEHHPTSAPDASEQQGHPEPSVDKQVPEHPSSALDIAASYLEHKTEHDPIETTRATDPEKQHQDTGSSKLGVAAGAAAIAAAAATLAKSSSAKKKGKKSKYADKRSSQEDDLFDDPSLWEGADKKHVSEAANAEVEKFWGGVEPQSASAQGAPAEPDTTKDEEHHKRQDKTMEEDDVFAPNTKQRDGPPIRQNPVESGELPSPKEKEELSKGMPSLTAPLKEKALDDNVESPVLGREEKTEEIPSATQRDARQSLDPEPSTMTSDLDEAVDRGFEAESRRDLSSVLSSRSPEPFYETGGFRSPVPSILPPVQEEAHEEAEPQPRSLPKTSSRRALRTPEPHRDSALSSGSSHPFRKSGLDSQVERDSGVMRDWQETSSQGREAQRTPELSSHRERRRSREAERAKSPSVRDLIRRSPFAEDETRDYPMSKTPVLRDPGSRQLDTPTPEPHKMRRISPELERKRSKYQDLASAALAGAAISSTSSPRSTPPPGNRSVSERVARLQSPAPVEPPVARRSISNSSLSRHRRAMGSQTPEPLKFRPESPGIISRPATATPPLRRRTDRRMSGDLRSLSQRSQQDLTQDPTSSSNTPVANEGRVRTKDMADVFDGFGEGRIGSPRSPTRPHSMRRRQSMQVLELESRVEQLLAENRMLADARTTADTTTTSNRASASGILAERDAEIDVLKQSLEFLQKEVARLTEVNEGLNSANAQLAAQHNERYRSLETQHADTSRQLDEVRNEHGRFQESLSQKDAEISKLRSELDAAKDKIRQMQRQILAAKGADADFLNVKDVDHFDHRCQQLCSHVQQWVLRFSKFSDMRACRLTNEINDEKVIDRLDNAILDGTDVDAYLADRVRRRDVFMSMTMNMIWEFVFTRYLFGMDREQRQKLKSLEKLLTEVGPPQAVRQWRAVTLTLLSKRPSFKHQRDLDTEAVVQAIFQTLSKVLPPPSNLEDQIQSQLRRVMREAVDLSIEMRTQRAEYMMLPPLQPEYDADGELAETVTFNAALMNERSGDKSLNNESLEGQHAVVRIVLFPLVVKKGDDAGNNDDEIVVCPAQVLVARPKGKSVRLFTPGSEVGGSVIGGNAAATHSELSMGTFLPEQASNVRSN